MGDLMARMILRLAEVFVVTSCFSFAMEKVPAPPLLGWGSNFYFSESVGYLNNCISFYSPQWSSHLRRKSVCNF